MAVADCVHFILCGLSAATSRALVAFIRAQVITLELAIAPLRAQLIYLDVLAFPARLAKTAAEAVIQPLLAGAGLLQIPAGIKRCLELSDVTAAVQVNINQVLSDVNIALSDLDRILSLQDEVQAQINRLEETLSLCLEVLEALGTCDQLAATSNL